MERHQRCQISDYGQFSLIEICFKSNIFLSRAFIIQKLDATAKNRFQIFILHPKTHVFPKKVPFLMPIK